MSATVYITKTSRFFPNEPVLNDDMERHLGMVNGRPSLARRIVLGKNGIKSRYYAMDANGNATHTNVEMAANAVRGLFKDGNLSFDDMELLACGTASPEQLIPSHGVQVHGELGGAHSLEVVSFAGSCCTGVQALKYAYLNVLSGMVKNAVACASERLSAWMNSRYFQEESKHFDQLEKRPMLAFEKEFLRWMLSDGAFALLVQNKPAESGLSLRIDWIEGISYANSKETCMYAGGEKDENGKLVGWASFPQADWLSLSLFAVHQDTRILETNIVPLGGKFMVELGKKHNFTPDDIDWYMPHLSSMYFKDKILEEMKRLDFYIPEERWFLNLPEVGNIASASAFAMIDGILASGKLKKGQKILIMVPESARFSYNYCMLTVC